MNKRKLLFLFLDIFLVMFAFMLAAWIKPATKRVVIPNYQDQFLIFLGIWLLISVITRKYRDQIESSLIRQFKPIVLSNLIILAVISFLMVMIHYQNYSRVLVFGTYGFAFVIELVVTTIYYYNGFSSLQADISDKRLNELATTRHLEDEEVKQDFELFPNDYPFAEVNQKLILKEAGERVYAYLKNFIDFEKRDYALFSTTTRFNIEKQPEKYFKTIVNLHRTNDILRINKFLEVVNSKLPGQGHYIGCLETKDLRKKKIFRKLPPFIRSIAYFFDFLYKRVSPKIPVMKQIYFFMNQGKNRVLSEQETFGRLYSCGFEHVDHQIIDGLMYFVFKKIKEPAFDFNPSYGPLFKMKRVGKDGKIIYVYKIRTMYPYSEYLQEYVYQLNKLDEGGKFKHDFRVTTAGRFMRKFWIDELPMLLNWVRGDMKLVGVRPLSTHYLSLYNEETRDLRLKVKPGLVPPFYMDMPKTLEEIMASERRYIESYLKHPFKTDLRYFFVVFKNILFKKARSK